MDAAFHFDSDHPDLGMFYGEAVLKAVKLAVTQETWTKFGRNTRVGDLRFHQMKTIPGPSPLRESSSVDSDATINTFCDWLKVADHGGINLTGDVGRFLRSNIFVYVAHDIEPMLAQYVHNALKIFPYYWGMIELNFGERIHKNLYSFTHRPFECAPLNNIAYWILATKRADVPKRYHYLWRSMLIDRCNAEDGISMGQNSPRTNEKNTPDHFCLTSAVQFGGKKDPLTPFIRLLGRPSKSTEEDSGVETDIHFWRGATLSNPLGSFRDRQMERAELLVKAALTRAPNLVLVVTRWFDFDDREMTSDARAALRLAGLMVVDRC